MVKKLFWQISVCALLGFSFGADRLNAQATAPKYEFRAVWVATVNNIDWPSKPGLPVEKQKEEALRIITRQHEMGMNAVILQVRPSCDAFYNSPYEPWSRYLTGQPGTAPSPYYDPLEFWIAECHKRGMELHAWFNPFRVAQNFQEPLAANHVVFSHPEWVLKYGNKLYLDPGLPETRGFISKVIADVVSRYDVDAIHFDDYFYPYPLEEDFPDTASFRMYNRGYTEQDKAGWRRGNVDLTIKMLNDSIKAVKPWVKFGISPFGVWRNQSDDSRGSATSAGTTNYDHLYADVIKWQREGWIDYLLPQLYWQIGHPSADFKTLAEWWANQSAGRAVYIGHGIYKIGQATETAGWKQPRQVPAQIRLLRTLPGIGGSAFYSSNHFNRDLLGLQDSLKNNVYHHPAIIPPMPWLDNAAPAPATRFKKSGKKIRWKTAKATGETDKPEKFVIYKNEAGIPFDPGNGTFIENVLAGQKFKFSRENKKRKKYEIRVSALDRLNNESTISKPVKIKL